MPLQEVGANSMRELKDIADTIAKSHKVLVVTGAGISTSCGIPDFRSKDGLYNMIPEQYLPSPPQSEPSTPSRKRKSSEVEGLETPSRKRQALDTDDEEPPSSQSSTSSRMSRRFSSSPASRMSGQDLFHARVFHRADTTQVFNQFIAGFKQKLKEDVKQTSKTHKFLRVLRDGGRLMRCYTQNIDGLEEREGLCVDLERGRGNKRRFMKKHYESPRPETIQGTDFDGGCEVVQLHGELSRLRCTMCSSEEEWTEEASEILLEGAAPNCNKCNEKSELRQATGKRGLTIGALRPNIVLYGEEHPQNTLLSPLVPYDIASGPEVLIIMGTSLKVFGMQKIIRDFAKAIHAKKNGRVIFVNRTRPAESVWDGIIDYFVEMDCDEWVDDLRLRRPGLWLRQGELDLKETKATVKRKTKSETAETETEDETVPTKRVKAKHNTQVSVNVPQKNPSTKQKSKPKPTSKAPPTPTSSHKAPTSRATKWRNESPSKAYKALLSPLARAQRPAASPLTNSFKSLIRSGVASPHTRHTNLPGSPTTPPFSPLTPSTPTRFQSRTPSRLRIHQDTDDVTDSQENVDPEVENSVLSPKQNLNRRLLAAQLDGALDDVSEQLGENASATKGRTLGERFSRRIEL